MDAGLESDEGDAFTGRQREVLDAALVLVVDGSMPLTMSAVANCANCSKETLYKWFGDREGLLTAVVRRQAAKVRPVAVPPQGFDRSSFVASLERFACDWLRTLAGETSVALNRLAIGDRGRDGALGRIVLENGPLAMRRRLAPVLEGGRAAGLLRFDDAEEAFRCFFGLVVRDMQIRLLLGDGLAAPFDEDALAGEAARAVRRFVELYGADAKTDAADLRPGSSP